MVILASDFWSVTYIYIYIYVYIYTHTYMYDVPKQGCGVSADAPKKPQWCCPEEDSTFEFCGVS